MKVGMVLSVPINNYFWHRESKFIFKYTISSIYCRFMSHETIQEKC